MSKVTSKLQVTLPKAIADRYCIRPGDEIEWEAAGDVIRVLVPAATPAAADRERRLMNFEAALRRQAEREARAPRQQSLDGDRGWTREDLYDREGSR